MAEEKKQKLTSEGLEKLQNELEDLKVNRRNEVAQKIKEARELGDLSENAEYDAAKDEQRNIEARIEEIEKILKNVEIFDGGTVKILDIEENEEMEYQIVGSSEANSLEGKISDESPVGKALIGAKKGEIVDVETPGGIIQYKILDFHM